MDYLNITSEVSSILSFVITLLAFVLAVIVYRKDYYIKLKFKYNIGVAINTLTIEPTYGISLAITNINAPTTIERVMLYFTHTKSFGLQLYPYEVQTLKSNGLLNYNFGLSKQQVDAFLKETDFPYEQAFFAITTSRKEFICKTNKSVNMMKLEAENMQGDLGEKELK